MKNLEYHIHCDTTFKNKAVAPMLSKHANIKIAIEAVRQYKKDNFKLIYKIAVVDLSLSKYGTVINWINC